MMEQVLRYSQEAGLVGYVLSWLFHCLANHEQDLQKPHIDPFLYLLDALNNLDKEYVKLEYELSSIQWSGSTSDLTSVRFLSQHMKSIANIAKHIDDILEGKDILRAQIQQQFSTQNQLPLDRSLQKPFREMMIGLSEIVNNFTHYAESIKAVKQFSLEDQALERGLADLASIFDKCQRYHQSLSAVVSTIKKMHSLPS